MERIERRIVDIGVRMIRLVVVEMEKKMCCLVIAVRRVVIGGNGKKDLFLLFM